MAQSPTVMVMGQMGSRGSNLRGVFPFCPGRTDGGGGEHCTFASRVILLGKPHLFSGCKCLLTIASPLGWAPAGQRHLPDTGMELFLEPRPPASVRGESARTRPQALALYPGGLWWLPCHTAVVQVGSRGREVEGISLCIPGESQPPPGPHKACAQPAARAGES